MEQAVWDQLRVDTPPPESLGRLDPDSDTRDEPLALTQLVLLYHLVQARESQNRAASDANG